MIDLSHKAKSLRQRQWFARLQAKTEKVQDALKNPTHPDMSVNGQMEYRVSNRLYRDIYALDIGDQPQNKGIVYFMTGATVFCLWLLLWVFIPVIARTFAGTPHEWLIVAWWHIYGPFSSFNATAMFLITCGIMYAGYSLSHFLTEKYWESQNIEYDQSLLNEYRKTDSRIMQPEELSQYRTFGVFPDAGAHSKETNVTTVIAHMALTNSGLNKVSVVARSDGKTDVDENGQKILKNVPFIDENGALEKVKKEMIDEDFGETLFDSSYIPRPQGKNADFIKNTLRKHYDPDKLLFNPEHNYGKPNYNTVADWINHDWYMPDYESQRPGGMYIVDTDHNNTMVLAMTRAGKGQSIIEPTIDIWLRQDHKTNIVVNDPKGELYLKFFYVANKRGYRVKAFNMMNEKRTDIYNPLMYAADAARRGQNKQTEYYVNTIGQVFFPPDKSDEPMWPNAANAAFQRTALLLIDIYMEREYQLRNKAIMYHWSPAKLEEVLDKSWGHVTLYNVYQMMTQLATKKSTDVDLIRLTKDDTSDEKDFLTLAFDATRILPVNHLRMSIRNQDDSVRSMAKSEKTMASVMGISLTAIKFFADTTISSLTSGRPSQNLDITGMAFPRGFELHMDEQYAIDKSYRDARCVWTAYSDPEMKKPLGADYNYENVVSADGWINYIAKGLFKNEVTYFKLQLFEQGTDIELHDWYFSFHKEYERSLDGRSYVINAVTHQRVAHGGYLIELQATPRYFPINDQQSLNVSQIAVEKIKQKVASPSRQRLVMQDVFKKAIMQALHESDVDDLDIKEKSDKYYVTFYLHDQQQCWLFNKHGQFWKRFAVKSKYLAKDSMLHESRISLLTDSGSLPGRLGEKIDYQKPLFSQKLVRYIEQPTLLFFVTPPHMMAYSKIALIALNQLFDMQVGKSYLTMDNQQPLVPTKYYLDEVGNLKSEGKGIPELQTKLSIGLGQGQNYTLVLQTIQQLKDIYGDSVDKILQGNTGNIIYLKSTDDSMLELLQNMSGKRHRMRVGSRTVNKRRQAIAGAVKDDTAINQDIKEEDVITKTMMLNIPRANAMVFGKENPIWAGNQLSLPYAHQLLSNDPTQDFAHPAKYTLNTLPTTANTMDFDIRNNMPNFTELVIQRVKQAKMASEKRRLFKEQYGKLYHTDDSPLSDDEVSHMNEDYVVRIIMDAINEQLDRDDEAKINNGKEENDLNQTAKLSADDQKARIRARQEKEAKINKLRKDEANKVDNSEHTQPNTPVINEMNKYDKRDNDLKEKRYANHKLSRYDLLHSGGSGTDLNRDLLVGYVNSMAAFKADPEFTVEENGTLLHDGQVMIKSEVNDLKLVKNELDKQADGKGLAGFDLPDLDDDVDDSDEESENPVDNNQNPANLENMFEATDAWLKYLASLDNWSNLANGKYDQDVGSSYQATEEEDVNAQ